MTDSAISWAIRTDYYLSQMKEKANGASKVARKVFGTYL